MCTCRKERRQKERKKEAILKSWNSWVASVNRSLWRCRRRNIQTDRKRSRSEWELGSHKRKTLECLFSATKRKGMKVLETDYSITTLWVPLRRTAKERSKIKSQIIVGCGLNWWWGNGNNVGYSVKTFNIKSNRDELQVEWKYFGGSKITF